jgi:hypothetical protein
MWYVVNTLGECLLASTGIYLVVKILRSSMYTGTIRLCNLRHALLSPVLDELWDTLQGHDSVHSDMHNMMVIMISDSYPWIAWPSTSSDALGVCNPDCLRINVYAMIQRRWRTTSRPLRRELRYVYGCPDQVQAEVSCELCNQNVEAVGNQLTLVKESNMDGMWWTLTIPFSSRRADYYWS